MPAQFRFSDPFVRNLRPPKKDDRPNQRTYLETMERGCALALVHSYGGSKTWRGLRYVNGKPSSIKLGTYPAVKVADARKAAREHWEQPEKFLAKAATGTFKEVAENWYKRHVEANALRSASEIARILGRPKDGQETKRRGYLSRWADRLFLEIRRGDVNALLDEIEDKNGRSQADAVLAVIRGIMTWHQSRDENYTSPIVRGMKRNKAKKARERILSDEELRAVWKGCGGLGTFGALVRICLLTGQRRSKVAAMKWADVRDGTWTIAHEDREKGVGGALKLPKAATEIIAKQPRLAKNSYVFAGRGKAAFNHWSDGMDDLRGKLPEGTPHWTLHDLRRTARSLMSRAGVRPDISERVLGHVIPGVEGVYDRHGYEAEKADALKRLAALIETILSPPKGNVIQLKRRR